MASTPKRDVLRATLARRAEANIGLGATPLTTSSDGSRTEASSRSSRRVSKRDDESIHGIPVAHHTSFGPTRRTASPPPAATGRTWLTAPPRTQRGSVVEARSRQLHAGRALFSRIFPFACGVGSRRCVHGCGSEEFKDRPRRRHLPSLAIRWDFADMCDSLRTGAICATAVAMRCLTSEAPPRRVRASCWVSGAKRSDTNCRGRGNRRC
jgi:hypothetical protein